MTDHIRRRFVMNTGKAVALAPLVMLVESEPLLAADDPMVDESSTQAAALKYVTTSEADGQNCRNCALYKGKPDSDAAPCALFPGMRVAGPGWCTAWVVKS